MKKNFYTCVLINREAEYPSELIKEYFYIPYEGENASMSTMLYTYHFVADENGLMDVVLKDIRADELIKTLKPLGNKKICFVIDFNDIQEFEIKE